MTHRRRPGLAASLWRPTLLLVAGLAVYANSFSAPFVFDDRATIVDNTSIEGGLDPARMFSPPEETPVAGRPVVNASFALNYAIGGREVTGYHVGNLLLHLCCALFVFGVVRRTLESDRLSPRFGAVAADLALATALIWVVHPLASEVVDYVSQRTESMMAAFYLGTLYASIRAWTGRRRGAWATTAVMACALGMASKETMVGAPLVVLAWDALFGATGVADAVRRRWRLYAGLAATWIVLGALVASGPRTYSAGFGAHDAAPWTYLLNQAVMLVHYARLAIWPDGLVLYYGWPRALTLADVWPQMLALGALGVVTAVGLWRRRPVAFLGAWWFVTLAPSSSVVPIPTEVGAERRVYLALIAMVAFVVIGAAHAWLSRRRDGTREDAAGFAPRTAIAAAIAVALVAGALGARTLSRNREYGSSLVLAETTLARWPTPAANSMLGTEYAAAGRFSEAEARLRVAAPDFPPARYYLGTVLARVGKPDEAITQLEAFIASQPSELDQVRLARAVLGETLTRVGRVADATAQFRRLVADFPADAGAHGQLATLLVRQEDFAGAIPHFQAALSARPGDAALLGGLGIALGAVGRTAEALDAFQRAVDADPANARAHQNLARMLAASGRLADAAREADRAAGLAPSDPAAHLLLGQILAEQGRRDEARKALERAVALDPDSPARQVLRALGFGG
ncbi:MAG: tetratricopeptide repeat protein [Vicinamibacterales bacterium]